MDTNKEKAGKLALKAGMWYVVSTIIVKAIAFITTPIFTRLMSTEEYGTVQTFLSWYTLLLPVFTLNLSYSIGRAKLDFPGKLDDYIGSMQVLSSLVSMAIIIVSLLFIKPVSSFLGLSVTETIILILYLFFAISILLYQNGYRYRYKYKQNIAIAWYTAAASTALSIILILVHDGNKADLRMIGVTVPTIVLSVFFWIKSIRGNRLHFNAEYWKYGLKISLPLVLHTISMHILSQSDRILITKICGESDTAFYSLAYTYGALLHVLTVAVSEGWLPWFHDTYYAGGYDDIRKKVKPLVVAGCYVGLACVTLAPEAVYVLGGSEYSSSINCVPPIVLGVVCQYIYTHYVNIELHLKKTVYVSIGTVIAAAFNIITNLVFIPKYGFIAAAYTTLASYFLLMLIHFFITKKVLHVKLYNDSFMFIALLITAVISALLMLTYELTALRYIVIAVGFITFLLYFKKYINKRTSKKKYG